MLNNANIEHKIVMMPITCKNIGRQRIIALTTIFKPKFLSICEKMKLFFCNIDQENLFTNNDIDRF